MDFQDIAENETQSAGDQEIACKDCGQPFVFSERDQEFYKVHGYEAPKRCRPCRAKKKAKFAERERYDNR